MAKEENKENKKLNIDKILHKHIKIELHKVLKQTKDKGKQKTNSSPQQNAIPKTKTNKKRTKTKRNKFKKKQFKIFFSFFVTNNKVN
jgi:hypothetical protein